ncbi:hypothetical protein HYW83_06785 [Candidatus Peregrinibacteria bacterium]|nr:hypothetical protein [Candidatus Peregrinibacteria bacterium]
MIKSIFQTLGLRDKEIQAFLKMLPLGSQAVSVMAKYVGIPRSSMYEMLARLKRLGVIDEWERNGVTYVKCIPVDSLPDLLKTRGHQIEQALENIQAQLPKLEQLENKLSITPKVKFYEGKREVMKIYETVLKEKEFYAAFNPSLVKHRMPEYYLRIGEELRKKNGRAKELVVDCKEGRAYQKHFASKLHNVKILPHHVQFPSDTIIGEHTIFMIAYGENEICATEIVNPSLAQTQRALFELVWGNIP